ncbi:tocopherol cyclase family protein [uncultured Ruthenibacterium sp.]|uniref:tocopherol cyclase family protein n=1 Tax=uncultured Ruthenibacterium sp. TaxID=1905347 RepID=UPI00349EAD5F
MRDSFCGWYFKCQSNNQTLAFIPALHASGGTVHCSLQVICPDGSWTIPFPHNAFQKEKGRFAWKIGDCRFGREGITLHLNSEGCHATGEVRFGPFEPVSYDVMGPLGKLPLLECRHTVVSMRHRVDGQIIINGKVYRFENALGYIEGDRGSSFPKEYAWTHCFFEDGSLMLSVADVPLGPVHFTGTIAIVHWHGQEYRLASYLGARVLKKQNGELLIRQGTALLCAKMMDKHALPLAAPIKGQMERTIRENVSCRSYYHFQKNRKTLFCFLSPDASFEFEYPI